MEPVSFQVDSSLYKVNRIMCDVFDVPLGSKKGQPQLHAVTMAMGHMRCPHGLWHSFFSVGLVASCCVKIALPFPGQFLQ